MEHFANSYLYSVISVSTELGLPYALKGVGLGPRLQGELQPVSCELEGQLLTPKHWPLSIPLLPSPGLQDTT